MKARRTEVRSQKSDLKPVTTNLWNLISGVRLIRTFFLALLIFAEVDSTVVFAVEGDIVFKRDKGEGGTPVAVFPHWFHRIRYKCYACHPALFQMKAGANKVSMEAIQDGKFCGACHNGKVAWAVNFETCNQCHLGK